MTVINSNSSDSEYQKNTTSAKFIPPKLKRSRFMYFDHVNHPYRGYTTTSTISEMITTTSSIYQSTLSIAPEDEKDTPLYPVYSDGEIISPRYHLQPPKALITKPSNSSSDNEEKTKNSDDSSSLSLSEPSGLMKRISSDELSEALLDINQYILRLRLKPSKAKSFNTKLFSSLLKHLKSDKLLNIDSNMAERLVAGEAHKLVHRFCEKVPIDELLSIPQLSIERVSYTLATKLLGELKKKCILRDFVIQNFISFKMIISKELHDKDTHRTDWLDDLLDFMELIISGKTPISEIHSFDEVQILHPSFVSNVFHNYIADNKIHFLLLKVIHFNETEALETIKTQCFWGSNESLLPLKQIIRCYLDKHLKHLNAQVMSIECVDASKELVSKIEAVDTNQIARSFLMGPELNLKILTVNSKQLAQHPYAGSTECCQKQFFYELLKELYTLGICNNKSDKFIKEQVANLLNNKPFIGRDIVFFGSISSWATCHKKLLEAYPSLFASPYKTRIQQGTECHIQICSKESFSIEVVKQYTVFPQLLTPGFKNSWSPDSSRPLCNIEINWLVCCNGSEGWSYKISTPVIRKLKATGDEWDELLDIILTPTAENPPVIKKST